MPQQGIERYVNTIIEGDCLEVMAGWPDNCVDTIITDPIWPNTKLFPGAKADALFQDVAGLLSRLGERLVIHLGCDSTPVFLRGITMPFLRVCWLRYARPHYKGRLLYGADVAYVFGTAPKPLEGRRVLPGEVTKVENTGRLTDHPCERSPEHVAWLVRHFARGLVLDPFCGSGTTCLAAKAFDLPFVGIDINPGYCEMARTRIHNDAPLFAGAKHE